MSKSHVVEGIPLSDPFVLIAQSAHSETTKNTNKLLEPNNVFETTWNSFRFARVYEPAIRFKTANECIYHGGNDSETGSDRAETHRSGI